MGIYRKLCLRYPDSIEYDPGFNEITFRKGTKNGLKQYKIGFKKTDEENKVPLPKLDYSAEFKITGEELKALAQDKKDILTDLVSVSIKGKDNPKITLKRPVSDYLTGDYSDEELKNRGLTKADLKPKELELEQTKHKTVSKIPELTAYYSMYYLGKLFKTIPDETTVAVSISESRMRNREGKETITGGPIKLSFKTDSIDGDYYLAPRTPDR